MIHVRPDVKLVFVRGIHRMREIREAIEKEVKTFRWDDWTIVGVSDEGVASNIATGMPFSPPDDRDPVGFNRKR